MLYPPFNPLRYTHLEASCLPASSEAGSRRRITTSSSFPGPLVAMATRNRWFVPHARGHMTLLVERLEGGEDFEGRSGEGCKGNRRWNSQRRGIDRDGLGSQFVRFRRLRSQENAKAHFREMKWEGIHCCESEGNLFSIRVGFDEFSRLWKSSN
ncbi:hypothetical protein TNCT_563091 [Trichonephila clavata]|uniref:Uncharacterized protein n=1 Tax=Trichonephila clavata TaxID=2740835 RepID=A0A8X6KWU1_TRICU|nr:hypothetical protein TNCT_563091 [Trichonephila clavata]